MHLSEKGPHPGGASGDGGNHVFTPEEGPGRKPTQHHAEAEVLSMWGVSRQMVLRQPHRVFPKEILSTWPGETRMMCVGAENKEAAIPAIHRDIAKKKGYFRPTQKQPR